MLKRLTPDVFIVQYIIYIYKYFYETVNTAWSSINAYAIPR